MVLGESKVSYKPLIEKMVWSYSRISSFDNCKYQWFLKYICGEPECEMFYASYGSFIHKLIEKYYRGQLSKENMLMEFLTGFSSEVRGKRPKSDIVKKYIEYGEEYLKGFQPFKFEMVDVEKMVKFKVGGRQFCGIIDYLGRVGDGYYIVDNKSRNLKGRSKGAKVTKSDELLDEYLRQLYLYSSAVFSEYGKFPKGLCFNCFKSGTFIEEPFDIKAYNATLDWAEERIKTIENCNEFPPTIDYFFCQFLCGMDCCYRDQFLGR